MSYSSCLTHHVPLIIPHSLIMYVCLIHRKDIASDDMDIRVKYAGMFHRKKGIISNSLYVVLR